MPPRVTDPGRGGQRGGPPTRSPRARAAGLVCGRGSGGGVARVIEPASQASAGQDANPVWHGRCGNKSPQRELGDCDVVHQREKSQARAGWQAGWPSYPQSPGSRLGAFMGKGKGLPVSIEPASQASERQDAEASLRGVSGGRMPVANVRRDGTGNPDPPRRWRQLGRMAVGGGPPTRSPRACAAGLVWVRARRPVGPGLAARARLSTHDGGPSKHWEAGSGELSTGGGPARRSA